MLVEHAQSRTARMDVRAERIGEAGCLQRALSGMSVDIELSTLPACVR